MDTILHLSNEREKNVGTNSVMSYYGWLGHANCNNLTKKYISKGIYIIVTTVCNRERLTNPLRGKKKK